MANKFTFLNVCEVISYSEILEKKDGSNPTALEIWHYSPTGELSELGFWFAIAEIELGLRTKEEVSREYRRAFKSIVKNIPEVRSPDYCENVDKIYKLIEPMDLPEGMKTPKREEDFSILKRNLPIRNIAHKNFNEVMQLIYSVLDVLEKDEMGGF